MNEHVRFLAQPAKQRAPRGKRKLYDCAHCGKQFSEKASHPRVYCSVTCKADGKRTKPKATPRPCACCQKVFTPSRKRGEAKWCSRSCIWKATRGPEYNAALARKHNPPRNRAARGTGTKGYVKVDGRHEHRVVMERAVGRPLLFTDVVHHKDEDKHNNDLSNLQLMTRREHIFEHAIWDYRGKA